MIREYKFPQNNEMSPSPRGVAIHRIMGGIWLMVYLVSCQWSSDGLQRLEQLYPTPDVAVREVNIPDVSLPDVSGERLAGYWVVRVLQPATMNILGSEADLILTDFFLAAIDEHEAEIELTFCHQDAFLDAGGLGATIMPEGTRIALGESALNWDLDHTGIPEQQVVWTWGLAPPFSAEEPLPENAQDSRVWDQDEDGHPGVTIEVLNPSGKRHMIRRTVWNIQHTPLNPEDPGQLRGTLDFRVDEGAVGYEGHSSLATIVPIVPSPEGGTFWMIKVADLPGTGYSCQDLIHDHPGLFKE